MEDFILSVLVGLVTSYIAYLCSKIKTTYSMAVEKVVMNLN